MANVGDSGCLRMSRATSTGLVRSSVGGPDRLLVGGGEIGTRDAEMPDRDRGLGRRLIVERLSRDHKPECRSELQRIQAAGGTVFPLPTSQGDSGGGAGTAPPQHEELGGARDRMLVRDFGAEVPRVWKAGASGPGLAMSRSIGDKVKCEGHPPLTTSSRTYSMENKMLVEYQAMCCCATLVRQLELRRVS